MEVLHEIKPNKKLAIALGYFDGIHIGHKKIINTLVSQARLKGLKTAVITFDKNPADYFNEKQTLSIQTFKDRQLIMNSLGVDYLYELDFEKFKELTDQVCDCVENLAIASRSFFRDFSAVRDYSKKVYWFEHESDKTSAKLKEAIFSSDLELAQKLQLGSIISEVADIADLAENCIDQLAIFVIKRDV